MLWLTTAVSAALLALLVWGLVSRRSRRPGYPLPPRELVGAERVGRVWTNNDPVLAVDARAAQEWTGAEGDYERLLGSHLEIGGASAAILTPEIDEGPVEAFALADGDLLLVSVTAGDDDWPEFLEAIGRSPAREAGRVDVPTGRLALFHAAAAHADLTVVEGPAAGSEPFADELLAIPVRPGSYDVFEAAVETASYALQAWRLTREAS